MAFLHNNITIFLPVVTHVTDLVAVFWDKSQQMWVKSPNAQIIDCSEFHTSLRFLSED